LLLHHNLHLVLQDIRFQLDKHLARYYEGHVVNMKEHYVALQSLSLGQISTSPGGTKSKTKRRHIVGQAACQVTEIIYPKGATFGTS